MFDLFKTIHKIVSCMSASSECREALYQGDKDSIFQVLDWLFTEQQRQPGLLHKRAFVGYYLGNIDVSTACSLQRQSNALSPYGVAWPAGVDVAF